MWSRNSFGAVVVTSVLGAGAGAGAADPAEPTGPKPQTAEITRTCERAEKRYRKLFPDAREQEDVVVVKLHKYTFCPPNLTVKPGTTVKWVNVDRRTSHSVWLKHAGIVESGRFFPEEFHSFTFTSPGKYPYLCGPHWKQEGMHGHVTVK